MQSPQGLEYAIWEEFIHWDRSVFGEDIKSSDLDI